MEREPREPLYPELAANEHVRLVIPRLDHAEASLSWVRSEEVIRLMGGDFSKLSLEGEAQRIRDILRNPDECSWMIELDGKVIGNISINGIREVTEKCGAKAGNLVFLIGEKEQWGKGIGSKACRAVLDWAFGEGKFEMMVARALEENAGSIKTLQRLGFEETGSEPYEGSIHSPPSTWRNLVMRRQSWS